MRLLPMHAHVHAFGLLLLILYMDACFNGDIGSGLCASFWHNTILRAIPLIAHKYSNERTALGGGCELLFLASQQHAVFSEFVTS